MLAVNDNSGLAHSTNLEIIEASPFGRGGRGDRVRLRVERHPFVDFADMRNRAFSILGRFERVPDWVMFLDADEVHGTQVASIARDLLPRLPANAGTLDGYTYHFWGTFGWISDIARRMAFYRYAPGLRWENAVHERIVGLHGRSIVVPYAYHHYGNVRTPRALAEKHGKYFDLGNAVPRPVDPDDATLGVYLEKASDVRRYRSAHPSAVRETIARLEREFVDEFAELDAAFARAQTPIGVRVRTALTAVNEDLRMRLRFLQRPGFYRLPVRAR